MSASNDEAQAHDRRRSDRRQQQVAIDFPDRRQGDRRGGAERRRTPRG